MTEYIVELPESGAADEAVRKFGIGDSRLYGYQLTGEIVRCRDCEYYIYAGYAKRFFCRGKYTTEPDDFCSFAKTKRECNEA